MSQTRPGMLPEAVLVSSSTISSTNRCVVCAASPSLRNVAYTNYNFQTSIRWDFARSVDGQPNSNNGPISRILDFSFPAPYQSWPEAGLYQTFGNENEKMKISILHSLLCTWERWK